MSEGNEHCHSQSYDCSMVVWFAVRNCPKNNCTELEMTRRVKEGMNGKDKDRGCGRGKSCWYIYITRNLPYPKYITLKFKV